MWAFSRLFPFSQIYDHFLISSANVLMFSVPAASQFVGLLAISMCGLSAISAITLCIGDKDFAKATGASAVRSPYLCDC